MKKKIKAFCFFRPSPGITASLFQQAENLVQNSHHPQALVCVKGR